jgi:hypothetical protein
MKETRLESLCGEPGTMAWNRTQESSAGYGGHDHAARGSEMAMAWNRTQDSSAGYGGYDHDDDSFEENQYSHSSRTSPSPRPSPSASMTNVSALAEGGAEFWEGTSGRSSLTSMGVGSAVVMKGEHAQVHVQAQLTQQYGEVGQAQSYDQQSRDSWVEHSYDSRNGSSNAETLLDSETFSQTAYVSSTGPREATRQSYALRSPVSNESPTRPVEVRVAQANEMRIIGEASAGLDTIRMQRDVSIPYTGDVQYQNVGTDRVATQTRTRHNTNKWVEEPRKSPPPPPPYRSQVISGGSQDVEYRDKIVEVEKIVHVDRPVEVCLLDHQKLCA